MLMMIGCFDSHFLNLTYNAKPEYSETQMNLSNLFYTF